MSVKGAAAQGPEWGALKRGHRGHDCGAFLSQASSDQYGCKEGDGASIRASGVAGVYGGMHWWAMVPGLGRKTPEIKDPADSTRKEARSVRPEQG